MANCRQDLRCYPAALGGLTSSGWENWRPGNKFRLSPRAAVAKALAGQGFVETLKRRSLRRDFNFAASFAKVAAHHCPSI